MEEHWNSLTSKLYSKLQYPNFSEYMITPKIANTTQASSITIQIFIISNKDLAKQAVKLDINLIW